MLDGAGGDDGEPTPARVPDSTGAHQGSVRKRRSPWPVRAIHGVFRAENSFVGFRRDPLAKAQANELRQEVFDKQIGTLLNFESIILASLVFLASGTCDGMLLLFQVAFTVQCMLIIFTVGVYIFATATHGLGEEAFHVLRLIVLVLFGAQMVMLAFAAIAVYFASC